MLLFLNLITRLTLRECSNEKKKHDLKRAFFLTLVHSKISIFTKFTDFIYFKHNSRLHLAYQNVNCIQMILTAFTVSKLKLYGALFLENIEILTIFLWSVIEDLHSSISSSSFCWASWACRDFFSRSILTTKLDLCSVYYVQSNFKQHITSLLLQFQGKLENIFNGKFYLV